MKKKKTQRWTGFLLDVFKQHFYVCMHVCISLSFSVSLISPLKYTYNDKYLKLPQCSYSLFLLPQCAADICPRLTVLTAFFHSSSKCPSSSRLTSLCSKQPDLAPAILLHLFLPAVCIFTFLSLPLPVNPPPPPPSASSCSHFPGYVMHNIQRAAVFIFPPERRPLSFFPPHSSRNNPHSEHMKSCMLKPTL